jgi:alcohol dehydrogenase
VKAWRIKGGGGSLTLEDLPIPTPREGGVTIRMWATPVLTYMADVLAGKLSTYAFPDKAFTPGTNGAGEITEVGRGVYGLRRGDHVILNPHYIANETGADPAQILIGLTRISADSAPMQSDWPDGTFAEYAHMPAAALTKVARDCGLPPHRLATFGKFAVPFGGLHDIGVGAGDTLIVVGASGNFGSAAVLLGIALGCARVIAAARDAGALASVVAKAGPRAVAVQLTGDASTDARSLREAAGGGADAAIDLVGRANSADASLAALRALRRGGRLALMGSMTVPLPLPYGEVMLHDWRIQGRFMYPSDTVARLLRLVQGGALDLSAVEIVTFPLDDLPQALTAAARQRALQATILTMQ